MPRRVLTAAVVRPTEAGQWVRVRFPDPAPGTWPKDADFRELTEGRRGIVLSVDDRPWFGVQLDGPRLGVHAFTADELVVICDECGHNMTDDDGCSWPYCPNETGRN